MLHRRRASFGECWKIVKDAQPDGLTYDPEVTVYMIGVPVITAWYWITGIPENETNEG